MKTFNILKVCGPAAALLLTACNGWLSEPTPGVTKLEDFFTQGETCVQTVNGCYSPLAWEFNSSYFSEWFIGDIASDDALKGGQNKADGSDAYDIDNFKTNANNKILLDYYRAKFMGISRCNLAIREVTKFKPDTTLTVEERDRLVGEAYFLRGFYYFQLVRVFGGVPLTLEVLDSSEKWTGPRATADEVYTAILSDLANAERLLWEKDKYEDEDLGRATRGAALAMLCKVNLYVKNYEAAYEWGRKFYEEEFKSGRYSLFTDYAQNFTLGGENGSESVFEIQYMSDPTSDYGEGFGFTRGTFGPILTRPRLDSMGANKGWGWNHPTQNLYDEFEAGDPRLALTIGVPTEAEQSSEEVNYLGSPYYNMKTCYVENGSFPALSHDSRGPLNYRLVRASDVLLMFAEAALESGKSLTDAKEALELVRARARRMSDDPTVLPAFPGYMGLSDTADDLRKAIRHERRVELAMEGHRWFDLVRWGIAAQVMDKDNGSYGKNESDEARAEMASFVAGKHELFPIPAEEIALNPMAQNPGY